MLKSQHLHLPDYLYTFGIVNRKVYYIVAEGKCYLDTELLLNFSLNYFEFKSNLCTQQLPVNYCTQDYFTRISDYYRDKIAPNSEIKYDLYYTIKRYTNYTVS